MQERIKKNIKIDHIPIAINELVKRNIVPGTIGSSDHRLPQRNPALHEANAQASRAHQVLHAPRRVGRLPLPPHLGTPDFRAAVELGYKPPTDFAE